jgi:hypothetical protein
MTEDVLWCGGCGLIIEGPVTDFHTFRCGKMSLALCDYCCGIVERCLLRKYEAESHGEEDPWLQP